VQRKVLTTKNREKTIALKREDTANEETMVLRKKTKLRQEKTTKLRLACSPNIILRSRTHKIEKLDMLEKGKQYSKVVKLGGEAT